MKLLGKIVCAFKGHKRGRLITTEYSSVFSDSPVPLRRVYACPRCNRETRYKVKPKSADVLQIPVGRT